MYIIKINNYKQIIRLGDSFNHDYIKNDFWLHLNNFCYTHKVSINDFTFNKTYFFNPLKNWEGLNLNSKNIINYNSFNIKKNIINLEFTNKNTLASHTNISQNIYKLLNYNTFMTINLNFLKK